MTDSTFPKIVFPDSFDERAEFEMFYRGYLSHVKVKTTDGREFPVYFVDPIRLQQDLGENTKSGQPFFAEPGLIVLPQVTLASIEIAVNTLWREGFFAQLKPANA